MPRKEDPERYCLWCKSMLLRKRYGGRLEDLVGFSGRNYCNQQCASLGRRSTQPNPTISRKHARDHKKSACEQCEGVDHLQVHHRDQNPLNNDLANLITLCASCHNTWHWAHRERPMKVPSRCSVCEEECERTWLGMCRKHYFRFKRHGDPHLIKDANRVLVRVP